MIAGREEDFATGVRAVARLCAGTTYVCKAAGSLVTAPAGERIAVEEFAGPHPAGTPGVHIHHLAPVHPGRTVWHIGYQDVLAIGRLVATGRLDVERVISVAGPGARDPRLLRVRLGAATDPLAATEAKPGAQRVISGSVLDGRTAQGDVLGYLGRYHRQVAIVPEGPQRELFGWIAPGAGKFSIWGVVLGHWSKARRLALTTTTNGSPRSMVPIGAFERVLPMDLMPTFLLRALITRMETGATVVSSRLPPLILTVGAGEYRCAPETVARNPFCAGTTTRYVPSPTESSASSSVPIVR